jgi:hypothetical protein
MIFQQAQIQWHGVGMPAAGIKFTAKAKHTK